MAADTQRRWTSATSSHGAFQCHYLRIRAIDAPTIPATKRPYSPLLLHLWKDSALEPTIFKMGLFSSPRLPSMSIWWWQNGLFILCSIRISVLSVSWFLKGCTVAYRQQQLCSMQSRPCTAWPCGISSWIQSIGVAREQVSVIHSLIYTVVKYL